MPASIALLLGLQALLVGGLVALFVGLGRIVLARRRSTRLRAPLAASGVGFAIALGAAIAIASDGAWHFTTATFTALH